jgi:peptidoglycan/LPS O-acetylase OafA/YrhL
MKPVAQPITMQKPSAPPPGVLVSHLPSLDGMRAISILLVLAFHAYLAYVHPAGDSSYWWYLGRFGVYVFFVISGMLITWLMIRERDATGGFSLRNFYIRRFLRILPVFWLLILVVIALKCAHVISISRYDIIRALTFTHNYPASIAHPNWFAGWLDHTWSLSLEEQFYLLWPSLFALLPRRIAPRAAVILAFSGPILRILFFLMVPSLRGLDNNGFESLVDLPMAGCAAAFLLDSPVWRDRIRRIPVWPALVVTSTLLLVIAPILVGYLRPASAPSPIAGFFMPTIEAVAIALTLLVVVAGKRDLPFRLLNSRVAVYVGKLSYSLYIWQQLFLISHVKVSIFSLSWRLMAVYLTAFCSFRFVEQPFIKLRSRFRYGVSV